MMNSKDDVDRYIEDYKKSVRNANRFITIFASIAILIGIVLLCESWI